MMNPYLILNVPLTATDAQIRAAWQRAVQEHPPERDALRFQEVQEAWQAIRDARARAAWAVRPREAPAASPADALLLYATRQKNMTPPGAAPASDAGGLLLPLIEMADRLGRAAAAFGEPPAAPVPWWPGVRAATAPWQAAWTSQRDALFILCSHMDTLLARAGLQRISVAGDRFDPASMTAVEVITDPSLPDHTVVAEILSGWQQSAGGHVVRPAQVKVSRQS